MKLWMFVYFINNEGEHLSTGKCRRSDIDIRALPAFVSTWELQGLSLKLFFLGKEINSPPKILVTIKL